MSFNVFVHSGDADRTATVEEAADALLKVPGIERDGDSFTFGEEPGERFVVNLDAFDDEGSSVFDGERVSVIDISVPWHVSRGTAGKAFETAFRVARDLGWRVYDPATAPAHRPGARGWVRSRALPPRLPDETSRSARKRPFAPPSSAS